MGTPQVPWHTSVPALEWNHIRKHERAPAILVPLKTMLAAKFLLSLKGLPAVGPY